MHQTHGLGYKNILIIVLSIILLIIGIWFGMHFFDEQGKVKELYVLLASCSIGFSLKNLYAIYKNYSKK